MGWYTKAETSNRSEELTEVDMLDKTKLKMGDRVYKVDSITTYSFNSKYDNEWQTLIASPTKQTIKLSHSKNQLQFIGISGYSKVKCNMRSSFTYDDTTIQYISTTDEHYFNTYKEAQVYINWQNLENNLIDEVSNE